MARKKAPGKLASRSTTVVRRASGPSPTLLADVRELIASARQRVAAAVNSELTLLYWQIGRRIREDILGNERAQYGKQIVHGLSAQLTAEFGTGCI